MVEKAGNRGLWSENNIESKFQTLNLLTHQVVVPRNTRNMTRKRITPIHNPKYTKQEKKL